MSKLENAILDLLAAADAASPKAAKITLMRGLRINARKDGGAYVLTLWRPDKPPSIQEWNVVCSHFPYKIPVSTPNRGVVERKYYLQGRIPAHPKVTGIQCQR